MNLVDGKKSDKVTNILKVEFDSNEHVAILFGSHEANLKYLAKKLAIGVSARGNTVSLHGEAAKVAQGSQILKDLYKIVASGIPVTIQDIDRAVVNINNRGQGESSNVFISEFSIAAKKKTIYPKSLGQQKYLESIEKSDLVFGVGPAGTGKTFLAMAMAVRSFLNEEVDRIVLTRPAIEAGEKIGFLPGDIAEKINPYLRPLYDALNDLLDSARVQSLFSRGQIEIAPIAFMRGRTLNSSFVILDEAQNCTIDQMKMFLTRIGFGSKVVVTGDMTQVDLPRDKKSGLRHALSILKDIPGISLHYFSESDVVRHPLVRSIIEAYDKDQTINS